MKFVRWKVDHFFLRRPKTSNAPSARANFYPSYGTCLAFLFVHYVNRSRYPAQETNTESVLAGTKLESGGAIAALAAIDRGSAAYRKCVARKNTEDGEFTNEMSEIIQMRLMSKFCHTLLLTRRLE